ncbi:MAG: CRISPR-associated protein Cas5 [Candidatus Competibacteraceae bacterium]
MEALSFRWHAKYGHFLRAEANVNALSYPVPPRTSVLGLVAAILGLEKDALANELGDAQVAVAILGAVPQRFWHRIKLRKDPPVPLPWEVTKNQKGTDAPEKAALILQEWLLNPDFLVHIALPEQSERFDELVSRVWERRWHFSPCMGLSEFLCDVEFVSCQTVMPLPEGRYEIQGTCLESQARLLTGDKIGVHLLRMPHHVSADRVFTHAGYYLEHQGKPFPVQTGSAWRVGNQVVLFS